MLATQIRQLPSFAAGRGSRNTHFQNHEIVDRPVLPLEALFCGSELAVCQRGSASLFHHSANLARTVPLLSSANPYLRGHYSWNNLDLMTYRLEGLIFPSILLVTKTHRWTVPPHGRTRPNVVLHFLGNGLTCGEIIRPVRAGEVLQRHWSTRAYA